MVQTLSFKDFLWVQGYDFPSNCLILLWVGNNVFFSSFDSNLGSYEYLCEFYVSYTVQPFFSISSCKSRLVASSLEICYYFLPHCEKQMWRHKCKKRDMLVTVFFSICLQWRTDERNKSWANGKMEYSKDNNNKNT